MHPPFTGPAAISSSRTKTPVLGHCHLGQTVRVLHPRPREARQGLRERPLRPHQLRLPHQAPLDHLGPCQLRLQERFNGLLQGILGITGELFGQGGGLGGNSLSCQLAFSGCSTGGGLMSSLFGSLLSFEGGYTGNGTRSGDMNCRGGAPRHPFTPARPSSITPPSKGVPPRATVPLTSPCPSPSCPA